MRLVCVAVLTAVLAMTAFAGPGSAAPFQQAPVFSAPEPGTIILLLLGTMLLLLRFRRHHLA